MKKYPIEGNGCVVGIFADDGRKFKSVYVEQKVMADEEFDANLKDAKHMSELAYYIIFLNLQIFFIKFFEKNVHTFFMIKAIII